MVEELREGDLVEVEHLMRKVIVAYYGEFPYMFAGVDDDDKKAVWVVTPNKGSVPFHISVIRKHIKEKE